MAERDVYRVTVTDNIVCAIEKTPYADGIEVSRNELEVSTKLSRNNLENGRLDGAYYFENREFAKRFAVLCLDFVKRLIDKTIETIEDKDFAGELACTNPNHRHDEDPPIIGS